jgi:hypothetical protein
MLALTCTLIRIVFIAAVCFGPSLGHALSWDDVEDLFRRAPKVPAPAPTTVPSGPIVPQKPGEPPFTTSDQCDYHIEAHPQHWSCSDKFSCEADIKCRARAKERVQGPVRVVNCKIEGQFSQEAKVCELEQ